MESNSDKEMRDKLRGVELPFDPKAWEQMDAMLEKDRKPKIFFWLVILLVVKKVFITQLKK